MKDENIKEILPDDFYLNNNNEMVSEIKLKDLNKIIDYITNLQEENKKLKNKLEDEKKNYKRITTYLQEENDDLKNRLENAVADCNLRLQENERLKRDKNMIFDANCNLSKVMNDYKSRIDKAIEYITIFKDDIRGLDEVVLLEILQGKSDE